MEQVTVRRVRLLKIIAEKEFRARADTNYTGPQYANRRSAVKGAK
jgi:hypothetical protein